MFKFSRTLYGNRQIIQFARILVEFVVRLLKDIKIAWKLLHFPWLFGIYFKYLRTVDVYVRDLRVRCLELYTACILSGYHWDKAFNFPGKFHFLVKTITDSVRLGVVYWNLVLSTASGVNFLWNLSTVCGPHHHDPRFLFIYLFILFSSFF